MIHVRIFFRLKKKWPRDMDSSNILGDVVHHLTHSKNTALSISLSSSRNESFSEGFCFHFIIRLCVYGFIRHSVERKQNRNPIELRIFVFRI